MLIREIVTESVGLANRRPGQVFKNKNGDELVFQGLQFFPQEGGAFPDADAAQQAVADYAQTANIQPSDIQWSNRYQASMRGFGIAQFTGASGPVFVGRWFRSINPNPTLNQFPNNAVPGGFVFQSTVGVKENVGYKPSEVLTTFKNLTPQDIYAQVAAHFGADAQETQAMAAFMAAKSFPVNIPRGTMDFSAFRDYFCEMLQPMALVMGKPVTGNASEAANEFFGPGATFEDCVISFNEGVSGGLYDSVLVNPEGREIRLSSKGARGANAAAGNLVKSVNELAETPNGKKLLKKYSREIDILRTIVEGGHHGAPGRLAAQFGLISDEEAGQISTLRGQRATDQILGSGVLGPNLEKLYQQRLEQIRDPSRIIPLEHMLAALAYAVADYVNNNTDFSAAATAILNQSAFIQVYTEARESADTISLTGFRAVYPSDAVAGVKLDATKAFMSTQGKGNFTFKILSH